MTDKRLSFHKTKTEQEIQDIYNFNVQAFADGQDFDWSLQNIKNEIKDGWELYAANYDNDIVAALFMRKTSDTIYTKNTPIKLTYQGNGFSHQIKEFYEEVANAAGVSKIINYCPADNFRMISLNEGHDYVQTGKSIGEDNELLEWEKKLK